MEELVDYYPYGKLSFADPIRKFKDYTISNKISEEHKYELQ